MKNQTTQKEAIRYIKEEDFMGGSLSREERREIRNLHKEAKGFMLWSREEVKNRAERFKNYIANNCSSGVYDYYADVIRFLENDEWLILLDGYKKYALNTSTFWRWLEKIVEVKEERVEY